MERIKVSLFSNFNSRIPKRQINIWKWLLTDQEDSYLVEKIRRSNNADEVRRLKERLSSITPSGIFTIRNSRSLELHSGLICIDIDGKDNPHINDMRVLKSQLSKEMYIAYCALSVSGNGVYCLVPISNPEKHKEHFKALLADFKDLNINVDASGSDICRLRAYSVDEDPYINLGAERYVKVIESQEHLNNSSASILTTDELKPITTSSLLSYSIENVSAKHVSKKDEILKLVEIIEVNRIDITNDYNDWFAICCILVNCFGKVGREIFHKISRFYPSYKFEECEDLFSTCLTKSYKYKIDNIFEIASKYGLFCD